MGYAKYVGRVGALAVALGIGVAVVDPGVAIAEPSEGGNAASADSSSPAAAPSEPSSSPSSTDTSISEPSTAIDPSEPGSASSLGDTSVPQMSVSSSGGAQTSTAGEDDEEPTLESADENVDDATGLGLTDHETADVDSATEVPPAADPAVSDPQPQAFSGPSTEQALEQRDLASPKTNDQTEESDLTVDGDSVPHAPEVFGLVAVGTTERQNAQIAAGAAMRSTVVQPTFTQTQAISANVAGPWTPLNFVSTFVSSVVTLLLGPVLAPSPIAPLQPPILWAVLAWVRRQFESFVFNQRPAVTYNPLESSQTVDGLVSGRLIALDLEDDPLRYEVIEAPLNGALTLNPNGTFTYSPDNFEETERDTFVVRVTDTGFHLPGLISLLTGVRHSTEETVTLELNHPPVVGSPPYEYEYDPADPDGLIRGQLNVTDPDDDDLDYSVFHEPNDGTLTLDGLGGFIYEPTQAAREQAASTPDITEYDSFSIDVRDAMYVETIDVFVPIAPAASERFTGTVGVGAPAGLGVSPDGGLAYVVDRDAGAVVLVDTATGGVTDSIEVGAGAGVLAVSSDGAYAYVTFGSNSVAVVDLGEKTVIDTIEVGFAPTAVVVSADGAFAYVGDVVFVEEFEATLGSVSVIDTESRAVVGTFTLGQDVLSRALALSPDGAQVYVVSSLGVSVIDVASGEMTGIPVDPSPRRVVVSPDGAHAYVTHEGLVSVIDTATRTVVDVVGVGHDPAGITVSPDSTRVYVVNAFDGTISVIDADTNTVIGTLDAGHAPGRIALSPDGARAYVTNTATDTITILDTTNITPTPLNPNLIGSVGVGAPAGLGVSPDGGLAYVVDRDAGAVVLVDTATGGVTDSIEVGAGAGVLAVSSDGAYAYVTFGSNSVAVVDLGEKTVIDTIEVGFAPTAVVVSADGAFAYVGDVVFVEEFEATLGSVSVIDTESRAVVGTFTLGQDVLSRALALSPDGAQVYVVSSLGVSVIDVASGEMTGIPVDPSPRRVVVSPDGAHAYVTHEGLVSVIDTATRTVVDVVGVGHDPAGITVSPDSTRVYVVNAFDGTISVIDADTNTVIGTLDAGHAPGRIALSPDGARAYVTNTATDTITILDTTNITPTPLNPNLIGSVGVGAPAGLGVSPDGGLAYVVDRDAGAVVLVDTATGGVTDSIEVGAGAGVLAVSSDGAYAYVTFGSNSVAVVDLGEKTVIDTIEVGFAPTAVVVSADGAFAYVGDVVFVEEFEATLGSVSVIDTESRAVVGTFTLGQDVLSRALALSPDGAQVYVVSSLGVSVIDVASGEMTGIPVDPSPRRVVVSPDGAHAYVTHEGLVSVIDTATRTVVDVVGVGHDPAGITVSPDSTRVYVVNAFDGTISVIDADTNTVIGTLDAGHAPGRIALSPDGARAYVTNTATDTITILDTTNVSG